MLLRTLSSIKLACGTCAVGGVVYLQGATDFAAIFRVPFSGDGRVDLLQGFVEDGGFGVSEMGAVSMAENGGEKRGVYRIGYFSSSISPEKGGKG